MAGRGLTETFGDGLSRVLQEVARVKMAPDADLDFLAQIEDQILTRLKSSQPSAGADMSAGMAGLPAEMGGGPPEAPQIPGGVPGETLSRGPAQSPDLRGMTAELERTMAG